MRKLAYSLILCLIFISISFSKNQERQRRSPITAAVAGNVAFDASSKGTATTGVSHVSTGSNIHMLSWLFVGNTTRSAVTVVSGIQSLSFVGTVNNGAIKIELWHLSGVTAGTATVTAVMDVGPPVTVYMVNDTFTDSTTLGTLVTSDNNGSSNPTVNVSSDSIEVVADGLCWTAGGAHTATVTAPSTQRQQDTSDTDVQYAISTQTGVATTTMAWTLDVNYTHAAIAVRP